MPSTPEIRRSIEDSVEAINRDLANVETIKKFAILSRNFTVESGEGLQRSLFGDGEQR